MANEDKKAAEAQAAQEAEAQRVAAAQAEAERAAAQQTGSQGDGPINSGNKSADEKKLQDAAAVPGSPAAAEAASRGVEFDHGEPDPRVTAEAEANKKAATDPWGTTPLQMRDSHDEAVDPQKVGAATRPDGTGLTLPDGAKRPIAPSGIEPGTAGDDAPQGTLPPV